MERVKSFLYKWVPPILWMALIFLASHQPAGAIPDYGGWDLLVKKGGHVLGYAILALLLRRAGLRLHLAFLFSLMYAVSDETHQRFVPGREGRLLDVMIDGLGASLGLFLSWWAPLSQWGRRGTAGEQSPRDA